MIRYPITLADLEARVDAAVPGWRARAQARTAKFRRKKAYSESSSIWSEVKPVFMELQGNKCGYCERKLAEGDNSSIEFDLEHYRPKSSVAAWPDDPASGAASPSGYYLLAYDLRNYLASCKKCNSPYKSNYFPVASARQTSTADPVQLATEKPLLPHPIGDFDDDPETLITFDGAIPGPAKARGHASRRARVTIAFFSLATREELIRERAEIIRALYIAWEDRNHPVARRRQAALTTINTVQSNKFPHRNCARSFLALCESDPNLAADFFDSADAYIQSILASG